MNNNIKQGESSCRKKYSYKKIALGVAFFVLISLLIFNFTFPNKQEKDLNSCLADIFNKSKLNYKDYCIKLGGIILDSGVCNFYLLREKALNGDLSVDSEIGECLKIFSN